MPCREGVENRTPPIPWRRHTRSIMLPGENLTAYLERESWHLIRCVDIGMTARVYIIERDGERRALKVRRGDSDDKAALRTEHRLLTYLGRTPMRRCAPDVAKWLPGVDGFLMTYLHYPSRAEKEAPTWIRNLASALRTLHGLGPPSIPGLEDDRPSVGGAVIERFRSLFEGVWRTNGFWAGLSAGDTPKLEQVRAHYDTYADMLNEASNLLVGAEPALIHGDLASDNVMLTPEGDLAIADWGSARIGTGLSDAASVSVCMDWSPEERRRFYELYLGVGGKPDTRMIRSLHVLFLLHRYRSCVQSLLWLKDDGEGLDAIGRAFLETQLAAL